MYNAFLRPNRGDGQGLHPPPLTFRNAAGRYHAASRVTRGHDGRLEFEVVEDGNELDIERIKTVAEGARAHGGVVLLRVAVQHRHVMQLMATYLPISNLRMAS